MRQGITSARRTHVYGVALSAASFTAGLGLILGGCLGSSGEADILSEEARAAVLGANCSTANVALNAPVAVSSSENAGTPAGAAVDGNATTRWASTFADSQWIQVDLGTVKSICGVTLQWEAAYAKAFQIQVSNDSQNWTTVSTVTNGTGGTQVLSLAGSGRFVRMLGTQRATTYGYSLFEFQVHTSSGTTSTTTTGGGTTGPVTGGGDLGPNVIVFDPSMATGTIQSKLDEVFKKQESNQFGTERFALFFKPGTYAVNANVGFYTSVAGLGLNPDDVGLGGLTVDAGWFQGNATQNFWRSAENLSVNGSARWAVAQAAPFRRIDVKGYLNLAPSGFGWASGGYIADSRVSGNGQPYSQQQWFTRDSQLGGWENAVWNMVFTGVIGSPSQTFPNPPYTVVDNSPVTREKPFLYQNASGYQVFVPSLRQNSRGTSWASGNTPGASIPLSQFYVAKPGVTAATLNQAVSQGLNLLFTPGIYHVNGTINITRANTVVLGLGYATIIPDNGVVPMSVADVDGVKIASLLFDAGTQNSDVLLRIGQDGSTAGHAANPISVQDVFFRIGGTGSLGKAKFSLVVNSNNTIIDHIWAWRADHGDNVGWTLNTAETGLVVNGNDVIGYGLFVEHYQKYNVIWNGNGGRTFFFQNELPYDPPNQSTWRTGVNGWPAYKVADTVKTHEAWGLGSYCFFNVDPTIHADHSFEVPNTPGVKLHDVLTVSLGGKGIIDHVVNSTGGPAQGEATVPSNLVSYP